MQPHLLSNGRYPDADGKQDKYDAEENCAEESRHAAQKTDTSSDSGGHKEDADKKRHPA
jgi:hypothetical protein